MTTKKSLLRTRTCLVTGQKHTQETLLRFVVVGNALVFDTRNKAPQLGRGGYVVPEVSAIDKLPHIHKKICHFLKKKQIDISTEALDHGKSQIT